jgi:DNA-directed RNA polymerase specialized sigma24 family protein
LGISEEACKKRIYRARDRFREALDDEAKSNR